jgi:hypothetical protein
MTRDEANGQIAETLLEKIRDDRYPSATQMAYLEEIIPREMLPEYMDVLLEKLAADRIPSVPMIQRIQRVARKLPLVEPND